MGKGDQRTRRGKIHRGTFGKRRPKKHTPVTKPPVATESKKKTEREGAE